MMIKSTIYNTVKTALVLLALVSFQSYAGFTPKQLFLPEMNFDTDEKLGQRITTGDGYVLFQSISMDEGGGYVRVFALNSNGLWRETQVLRGESSLYGDRIAVDGHRFFVADTEARPGDIASPFASGVIFEYEFDPETQQATLVREIDRPKLGISAFATEINYDNGWLITSTWLDQLGTENGLEGGKLFIFKENADSQWELHSEIWSEDFELQSSAYNGFGQEINISYPWLVAYGSVMHNSLTNDIDPEIQIFKHNVETDEWEFHQTIESVGFENPTDGLLSMRNLELVNNDLIFDGRKEDDAHYVSHYQYNEVDDIWSLQNQFNYELGQEDISDNLARYAFARHIKLDGNRLYISTNLAAKYYHENEIINSLGEVLVLERSTASSSWEEVQRFYAPIPPETLSPPAPLRAGHLGTFMDITPDGELFVASGGAYVYGEFGTGAVYLFTEEDNTVPMHLDSNVASQSVSEGKNFQVSLNIDNLSERTVNNILIEIDRYAGGSEPRIHLESSSHSCWEEATDLFYRCKIDNLRALLGDTVELNLSASVVGEYDLNFRLFAAPQDAVPENRELTIALDVDENNETTPDPTPEPDPDPEPDSGSSSGSSIGYWTLILLFAMVFRQSRVNISKNHVLRAG
ncbi:MULTISPECIES: hypothetical protein [Gammaproteobacteria]|uniref:hypothetical protein n=1 Tax=Gammaproteobacteria TaxID=1236 RepID=UPI000DCF82CC|nr:MULTISPECIES: hypothetical protein [Gammaproteobacteria]RTE85547.1 hypothetical protein DQX04_11650 [Aliidiomarina sp. B3213]TCZ89517.1 hypothetical protein EYQ95_11580 [Lysobacter sp. N42]